jgi:hypothetical protein
MMLSSVSEQVKVTLLYQGAANAVACDVVSFKNFHHGAFVVMHSGSSDTDLVLSLYEATTVAAGTNQAITTAVPLYVDADMGTSSDTLVRQTDAYAYTIDTGVSANQMVVFEVDPSILSDGYDCVYLADSGGNASNTVTILFVGAPRYSGATLPTAITD